MEGVEGVVVVVVVRGVTGGDRYGQVGPFRTAGAANKPL